MIALALLTVSTVTYLTWEAGRFVYTVVREACDDTDWRS